MLGLKQDGVFFELFSDDLRRKGIEGFQEKDSE